MRCGGVIQLLILEGIGIRYLDTCIIGKGGGGGDWNEDLILHIQCTCVNTT